MSETGPQHDPWRQDGYLRACEGILRTRFGRRPFTAVSRVIEQLKREEEQKSLGTEKAPALRWWEAVAWFRGRAWVPLSAAAVLAVLGAGLFFAWHGRTPQRIAVGKFTAVMGTPTIQHNGQRSTLPPSPTAPARPRRNELKAGNPQPSTVVYLGDRIETGDADKAEIQFNDGTTLSLNFNTALEIPAPTLQRSNTPTLQRPPTVNLLLGQIWSKVQKTTNQPMFSIATPVATAAVRGTEFGLKVQRARLDAEIRSHTMEGGDTNAPAARAPAIAGKLVQPQKTRGGISTGLQNAALLHAVLTVKEGTVEFFNALGKVEATEMTESVAQTDTAPTQPKRVASLKFFQLRYDTGLVVQTQRPVLPMAAGRLVFPFGWAGLQVKDVAPEPPAGAPGPGQLATTAQIRVVRVRPASPASQAGVQVGDVVTTVNGHAVNKAAEITAAIATRTATTLALGLVRGGEPTNRPITVTLTTAPPPDAPPMPSLSRVAATRLHDATRLLIEGETDTAQQALEQLLSTDTQAAALNNLGLLYETKDRPSEAILSYHGAVQLEPQAALYHFNLGMALRNIGNLERAMEEFETARLLAPKWAEPVQEVADVCTLLDRPEEALEAMEAALKLNSQSPDLWLAKATVLRKQHRTEEARQAVLKAIELEPACAAAYRELGDVFEESGNLNEAEKALRKAIEIDPADDEAFSTLGDTLDSLGRLDEAEQRYRRAIALNPTHAIHYSNLGYLYMRRRQPDEAEKLYRKAIELEPENTVPYANLGELYRKLGRLDEAEQMLRTAIRLAPNNVTALNNLGGLYHYNRRQLDEAEKIYREAIRRDPSQIAAYYNLAILCYDRRQYDEEEKLYRKVIELDPTFALAYNNLGFLQEKIRNQPDEAEKMYRKAIEADSDCSPAYNNLGRVCANRGQWDEAERMYRKAIEVDPSNATARRNLIRLLADRGIKLDQALALALAALKDQPENPGYLDVLGWVRCQRGELTEAETALKKSLELFGDVREAASAWVHLGRVREQKGEREAAREAYRKALSLQPDNQEAKAALDRLGKEA